MTSDSEESVSTDRLYRLVEKHKKIGIRWRTYINPMRDDGLFVAEDKPLEPYPEITNMDGSPVFPAIPNTKYSIGFQLPHKEAKELVRLLNEI